MEDVPVGIRLVIAPASAAGAVIGFKLSLAAALTLYDAIAAAWRAG